MTKRYGSKIDTSIDLFSLEFLQPLKGTRYTIFEAFYYLLKEFYGEVPDDPDSGDYTGVQKFEQKFSSKKLQEDWGWGLYDVMMFLKTLAFDKVIHLKKISWDDEIIVVLNENWEKR